MFSRFNILLTLVGAVIVTVIVGYCLLIYSAAKEADTALDRRNAELFRGQIASHAENLLAAISKLAVSQPIYDAVSSQQAAELEKRLCLTSSGSVSISALGLMLLDGKAVFLCDGGKLKQVSEHGYMFEFPKSLARNAFDEVFLAQEHYQVIVSEFSYKQQYVQLANRTYLLLAALVAPDQKKPLPKTYRPVIMFAYSNMDSALSNLGNQLGIEGVRFAGNDVTGKVSSALRLQEGSEGQSTISIYWSGSNIFRTQLLKSFPLIIGCSILAFLTVVYLIQRIGRLQNALVARENHSQYMAQHDSLTHLPNRRYFLELAEKAVSTCSAAAPVYVGIFDLDKFKSINDTFGHDVGDMVIAEVARRATAALGTSDVVARLGGDEFAFILTNARDDRQALNQLNSLGHAIRQIFDSGSHRLKLAASIGAACAPRVSMKLDKLLKAADLSLYAVKAQGGDHSQLFSGYDAEDSLQASVQRPRQEKPTQAFVPD